MAAPKTPRKRKPQALAPKTGRPDPEEPVPVYIPVRNSGVRVDEDTALTLGAVYACVRVISEDLAGLPWHVHERLPRGGSVEVPEDPADWLLHTQASPETPAFQFRETILAHALTWGNGYAEIERDLAGRPRWLWLLTPDRVEPFRSRGELWYEVKNPNAPASYIPAEDMFHLRGLGFDGLVGYSVIRLAARSIGAGIALDQSTSDLFANDSTPGGVLTHPSRLSPEAHKRLKEDWEKRHMGPANRRRVAVLEEGMKWEQTGLPPEDSKLIEQRQFTPADICRWFRVKPHKIADLSRATFSNIEAENTSHVTDTLLPWARRLETEANIKLFGRTNRGLRFTKVNFKGFLRGDAAARAAYYTAMIDRGIFDINEVRGLEDMNPIPDGDKRFVPLNMQLLENAGEEPPPGTEPEAPDAEDAPAGEEEAPEGEEQDADEPERMRAALAPVFEDAMRRVLRRESQIAETPLRGGAAAVYEWYAKAAQVHGGYFRAAVRPAAAALAVARRATPDALEAALAVVAERHLENFRTRLADAVPDPATAAEWETLAPAAAARLAEQLTSAVEATR